MSRQRFLIVFVVAALLLACIGCDKRAANKAISAIGDEIARDMVVKQTGPPILASIVGASAPLGGPSALQCLCTNAALQALYTAIAPELKHPVSPLAIPDPDRPVKIVSD